MARSVVAASVGPTSRFIQPRKYGTYFTNAPCGMNASNRLSSPNRLGGGLKTPTTW